MMSTKEKEVRNDSEKIYMDTELIQVCIIGISSLIPA